MSDYERTALAAGKLTGEGNTTIKGRDWMATVPHKVAQDFKDGAALRRLREAAAGGADVEMYTMPDGTPLFQAVIGKGSIAAGTGDTIEEAADKCREALHEEE